ELADLVVDVADLAVVEAAQDLELLAAHRRAPGEVLPGVLIQAPHAIFGDALRDVHPAVLTGRRVTDVRLHEVEKGEERRLVAAPPGRPGVAEGVPPPGAVVAEVMRAPQPLPRSLELLVDEVSELCLDPARLGGRGEVEVLP